MVGCRTMPGISIFTGIIIFIGVFLFFFKLERKIHYGVAYKAMVQETVREMVRPEALNKEVR